MINYDYHTKVYYKDVDQMGVVYYTRYLEYFEQARTELLREIGVAVKDIEDWGFFLPVVSVQCDYRIGARFEDEIIVRTKIKDMPRARLRIDYAVYRNADEKMLVSGFTIHSFTDKAGRAKRPPQMIKKVVEKYF